MIDPQNSPNHTSILSITTGKRIICERHVSECTHVSIIYVFRVTCVQIMCVKKTHTHGPMCDSK